MHKFNLQKYYFISEYDTNLINVQDKKTNIIYRNYVQKIDVQKILKLKKFCKKKGYKFFLSNNVKLAMNLGLNGVYLPSFNKSCQHLFYNYKKGFEIIGSAHSFKEIKIKEIQRVNKIFLSSLFKDNKNYLGLNKFRLLSKFTKKKIIALGGMSGQNIKKLNLTDVTGYSGISIFKKKGPYK
jgi:thiamine-phosphate pyrophosphorylase